MSTILLFGVSGTEELSQWEAEHRAWMAGACGNGLDTFLSSGREGEYDLEVVWAAYEDGMEAQEE